MAIIKQISPDNFSIQDYTFEDYSIVPNFSVTSLFQTDEDLVEYFIYDDNNNLISGEYSFRDYSITLDPTIVQDGGYSTIDLSPFENLKNRGLDYGKYNVVYNFLEPQLGSSYSNNFFIKEISSDRTELKLSSNTIPASLIQSTFPEFKAKLDGEVYFNEFYLNFGDNKILIAINSQLEGEDVLVKLYEPLPSTFTEKTKCWINIKIADPIAYNVDFLQDLENNIPPVPYLRGPNINIQLKDEINNTTDLKSYNDLISTVYTSSFQQVDSLLNEKGIAISVDYTDFSTFVHFSSAEQRLLNFYEKVTLIEGYQDDIYGVVNQATGSTSSSYYVSESREILQTKVNDITQNFDGYERYLYFESGSYTWPKSNSIKPYELYSTASSQVTDWLGNSSEVSSNYGGLSLSASIFDNNNQDNLLFTIPEYIRDDSQNAPYELFTEMIGQHFDNIWMYSKDVVEKYNADNRLDFGISKDLVAQALRDFGFKIHQNNFSDEDLYSAFLGITPSGSLLPSTGSEHITSYITASSDVIPLDDTNKNLYKRLYHNLPYLLKKKGTVQGVKALIASYGIPNTVLRVSEFGGKDRDNTNDWDYFYNRYNKALTQTGNRLTTDFVLNSLWGANSDRPEAIEFRFKAEPQFPTNYSQSLFSMDGGGELVLKYSESPTTSGSYSGSIVAEDSVNGEVIFFPDSTNLNESASVVLPIFNNDWWAVLINSSSAGYDLFVKNKIYEGEDASYIGFQASSSLAVVDNSWVTSTSAILGYGTLYGVFSGSLQEIRYYSVPLNETSFNAYVMNPQSIEGNSDNSSPDELAFRAPLGGELENTSASTQESIHPKITGSWASTSSFVGNSTFTFTNPPEYETNIETVFLGQPIAGAKNRITDKIRVIDQLIPSGSTLSKFRSLEQTLPISQSYTPDLNLLEVAFSPQNEINDDIMHQMGDINLGDYIGDPRYITSSRSDYEDLANLSEEYFKKYTHNYTAFDYIRLIKYFDNSLFKMIKDFVPARTSLTSGVVIKQHLLERNRVAQPQISHTTPMYSGSILDMVGIEGGAGGSINKANEFAYSPYGQTLDTPIPTGSLNLNITQSQNNYVDTVGGLFYKPNETQEEFYNGEYSGSLLTPTTQSLNSDNPFLNPNVDSVNYTASKFTNTDFDVMQGNVSSSRENFIYQDVDYSSRTDVAVNSGTILAGSASKATVQDSNYTLLRQINPRYDGSRTTSQFMNVWTEGDTNTYGKTPTADSEKTYFVKFDFINGLGPELKDKSIVHISNLVDQYGNNTPPDSSSLGITQKTFKTGEIVTINLDDPLSFEVPMNKLNGEHTILRGGSRVDPVLYSDSGSSYTNTLNFDTGSFNVTDYQFNAIHDFSINPPSASAFTHYPFTTTTLANTNWDGGTDIYTFAAATDSPVKFIFNGAYSFSGGGGTIYFYIAKNWAGGYPLTGGGEILAADYYGSGGTGVREFSLESDFEDFEVGDTVQVIYWTDFSPISSLTLNTYFDKSNPDNFLATNAINPTGEVTSSYWSTGSTADTWVTSSIELAGLYGSYQLEVIPYTELDVTDKFDPIIQPFTVKVGDEIRFLGAEVFSRMVTRVITPSLSTDGALYLELDRALPSFALDIDHFLIRTYSDDASYVIIDTKKPLGSTSPGFMKSKFLVKQIRDNYSTLSQPQAPQDPTS